MWGSEWWLMRVVELVPRLEIGWVNGMIFSSLLVVPVADVVDTLLYGYFGMRGFGIMQHSLSCCTVR